jgi:hypothetical protein
LLWTPNCQTTRNFGMGDKFEEKAAKVMSAGTYGHWPAGM